LDVDDSDVLACILEASEFGAREHAVAFVGLGNYLVDQVLAQSLLFLQRPHNDSLGTDACGWKAFAPC